MAETKPKQAATPQPAQSTAQTNKNSLSKRIKRLLIKNQRIPYRISEQEINKISNDEAKFYLELSEKQLQDSVDTGQIITERATNMLNITSALLIALIAYSIDRWETKQDWDLLMKLAIWGDAVLVVISGLLITAILPKDYCIPGWTPDKIITSPSYTTGADADTRQKNLTLNLLMSYETDIKQNRLLNRKRWALFNWSLFVMMLAPICFASYYLVFR